MKFSTLMGGIGAIVFVVGIGFVLAPGTVMSLFSVTLSPAGLVLAQLYGAALIGFGVLDWLCRNVRETDTRRGIILGNLVVDVIGFVATALGQLAGFANALGWVTAALFLLFGLGFGYFYFADRPDTQPAR